MIKAEVIENFTLAEFEKLKNIVRKYEENNMYGKLYEGDTFECDETMADYLLGNNHKNKTVIKVLEEIPNISETLKEVEVEKIEEAKEDIDDVEVRENNETIEATNDNLEYEKKNKKKNKK